MGKTKLPFKLISIAGVEQAVPQGLPPTNDTIQPLRTEFAVFGCGHLGRTYFALHLNGRNFFLTPEMLTKRRLCSRCALNALVATTIRCGLCGQRIANEEPVALYRDTGDFRPDATKTEHEGQTCVIGCHRCAPSTEFLAGIWIDHGFKPMIVIAKEVHLDGLFDALLESAIDACSACPRREECQGKREAPGDACPTKH